MKKSSKVSAFYILSSISLLLVLVIGGIYGVYVSVGLNFARSNMSNITGGAGTMAGAGTTANVSYNGSVNFNTSMTGVIILSIVLVVLAIFDIISLIKQVVLFKQFKVIENSTIENKIEKKVKSKGAVIFFAGLIDILCFAVGIAGIFLNSRAFVGNTVSWVLYLIDGLVSLFALVSFILLIVKLKNRNKKNNNKDNDKHMQSNKNENYPKNSNIKQIDFEVVHKFDIDEIENKLLKLKHLKSSKMISSEEFERLRRRYLNIDDEEIQEKD